MEHAFSLMIRGAPLLYWLPAWAKFANYVSSIGGIRLTRPTLTHCNGYDISIGAPGKLSRIQLRARFQFRAIYCRNNQIPLKRWLQDTE